MGNPETPQGRLRLTPPSLGSGGLGLGLQQPGGQEGCASSKLGDRWGSLEAGKGRRFSLRRGGEPPAHMTGTQGAPGHALPCNEWPPRSTRTGLYVNCKHTEHRVSRPGPAPALWPPAPPHDPGSSRTKRRSLGTARGTSCREGGGVWRRRGTADTGQPAGAVGPAPCPASLAGRSRELTAGTLPGVAPCPRLQGL